MRLIIKVFVAILLCGCSDADSSVRGDATGVTVSLTDVSSGPERGQDATESGDLGPPDKADVGGGDASAFAPPVDDTVVPADDVMEVERPGEDTHDDVTASGEDVVPRTSADTESGEDGTGIVVVGDSSSGPIFGPQDTAGDDDDDVDDAAAGTIQGDSEDEVVDVVEEDSAGPVEPSNACLPNPCQQGPAAFCLDGVAIASFVPGECTTSPGGVAVCDYVEQAMDCAAAEGSCLAGLCKDSPPSPVFGELVITEVMRAPHPNNRQWLELYVAADEPRNLAGCGVMDGASNRVIFSSSPQIVQPGQFVLVAEAEPTNDGLPTPDVTVPIGQLNLLSVDGPLLVNCMGTFVDQVDLPSGTELVPFPADAGVAMQVSPGNYEEDKNDTSDVWCGAEDPYTFGAFGSPGAPNPACNADIDRCRLWYPAFGSGNVGEVIEALATVFDPGVTDTTLHAPDPVPGFLGEIGLGPDGVNPEVQPDAFTWFAGAPNYEPPATVPPQDDMYGAWVIPETSGIFDLAARFSPDAGTTWIYCDLDGSDNGYELSKAGHVLVQP